MQTRFRRALAAGSLAGVVSGAPSTLLTARRGGDLLESTRAAGSIVLGRGEHQAMPLVLAGGTVHLGISVGWALVLDRILPRRLWAAHGAVAGLAIAALDLMVIGRALPAVRRLALLPQALDHVAYGITVAVLLRRLDGSGARRC